MNRTVLQVPLDSALRKEAEKQALSQGFSSLQEAVRIFLKKLAKGEIEIIFKDKKAIISSSNSCSHLSSGKATRSSG